LPLHGAFSVRRLSIPIVWALLHRGALISIPFQFDFARDPTLRPELVLSKYAQVRFYSVDWSGQGDGADLVSSPRAIKS
jgi:hypothetical protein